VNAKKRLEMALRHPFDEREPTDAAHCAALGSLAVLTGRRGIGDELEQLDEELRTEIVDAVAEVIREAMPGVARAEPAPALDSLAVCVKLLDWNRSQPSPPIAMASEYHVANTVLGMAALCPAGGPDDRSVPKSPDGNFNTGDGELDLLLGLTEDLATGNGNMDTGLWWLEVLGRVKNRLVAAPAEKVADE
jgi:hypothetical protein